MLSPKSSTQWRMIYFHPATPISVLTWIVVQPLIFGGIFVWRWLHWSGIVLSVLGILLLILAKTELCLFDKLKNSITIGRGIWRPQWIHALLTDVMVVRVASLALEDLESTERDTLYRVELLLTHQRVVPLLVRWRSDLHRVRLLAEQLSSFLALPEPLPSFPSLQLSTRARSPMPDPDLPPPLGSPPPSQPLPPEAAPAPASDLKSPDLKNLNHKTPIAPPLASPSPRSAPMAGHLPKRHSDRLSAEVTIPFDSLDPDELLAMESLIVFSEPALNLHSPPAPPIPPDPPEPAVPVSSSPAPFPPPPPQAQATVAIIMGSDSDLPVMSAAADVCDHFRIPYCIHFISAHRTPDLMVDFARSAHQQGIRVIVAGAGGAAHLPGMVAALTPLPVIGVPVPTAHLQGVDSLYSIVQMPRGIPVATVAIGNAHNAGLLAVQILATHNPALLTEIQAYRQELNQMVRDKDANLQEVGYRHYLAP